LNLAVLGCVGLLFVGGCFVAAPENEITWAVKATTGNLAEATPTEWQAVAAKINEVVPEVDVALSDAQAEAVVTFVQQNNITGVQGIQEKIAEAQADPSSVVIPDGFFELFSEFAATDYNELIGTLQE
jgi:hypothetical protein